MMENQMEKMRSVRDCWTLSNGSGIPCFGFGTFNIAPNETYSAVSEAIKRGYRHIDTAATYQNEEGVGKAVRECAVNREDLYVTSKVWITDRGYDNTRKAFETTMKTIGLDYLDLYLIHWPANRKDYGDEARIINADTWRALEAIYEERRVKAIGVCNFWKHHMTELLEDVNIRPMVNQIEIHPGFPQEETIRFCLENNIAVEAWGPLGRSGILENKDLLEIAEKYDRSVAQICIRWIIQQNCIPLVKSVTPARMEENQKVFDFSLSREDMDRLNGLRDIGGRCLDPDTVELV